MNNETKQLPYAFPPELLRIEQVAQLLNISERTIYRMQENASIPPPVELLGSKRWQRSVLLQWIADGCPPSLKASCEPKQHEGHYA